LWTLPERVSGISSKKIQCRGRLKGTSWSAHGNLVPVTARDCGDRLGWIGAGGQLEFGSSQEIRGKGAIMPTYVLLINFTDQGIRNVKDSPQRRDAAAALAEQMGAKFKEVYWTLGSYDLVTIVEAPDDETVTAFALAAGSQGNIRTTTLRAFDQEQFQQILNKTP
jgi:uncharacterized protein with GYD domain